MTSQPRRIPDSLLECYLADSLDALTRARLKETMANSPADRARLEELRADSAAFLIQHPPGPLVERFRQERKRRRWWRWPELLMPTFAVVFLALLMFHQEIRSRFDPNYIGTKGPAILVLHRKTEQGSELVSSSMQLAPGDTLGFEVRAAGSGYIAVLGRDAKGVVSVYHPYGGTAATAYDVAQQVLPGAIELDDTLGREDLYVLHSPRPFALEWAVQALEKSDDLHKAAPRDVTVGSTFIMKAKTP